MRDPVAKGAGQFYSFLHRDTGERNKGDNVHGAQKRVHALMLFDVDQLYRALSEFVRGGRDGLWRA